MKIIDGHSHFGIDSFWPNEGNINEYISMAKILGIEEVNAMSTACPIIQMEDKKICLLIHGDFKPNMEHFRIVYSRFGKSIEPVEEGFNPYKLANDMLYNMCNNNNSILMNYIPLIHPYYYSYEDFIDNIKKGARMLKIHGIAAGVVPWKIPEEFFRIIELINIPIIIHTDYSDDNNLLSCNSAFNWYEVLKKYKIKVYFAHAARLDDRILEIVNKDDRYLLGIGPDMYLSCPHQNMVSPEDYLKYCFEKIDINKIIFDIDYPWNIKGTNNYELDWSSIDRINMLLSEIEREKVYSQNIMRLLRKEEL